MRLGKEDGSAAALLSKQLIILVRPDSPEDLDLNPLLIAHARKESRRKFVSHLQSGCCGERCCPWGAAA